VLLACDTLDATTAVARGLADRLGTVDEARALAQEIASYAPLSLMYSKHAVQALTEPDGWDDRLDAEFDQCWASADFVESRLARAENRLPKFVGK
jgi:enoyl-CoA hydratase